MFGYFDESGKFQDSDFVCIAGFLADDTRWNTFVNERDELLRKFNLRALYMRQVMPLQGPFAGWDRDRTAGHGP